MEKVIEIILKEEDINRILSEAVEKQTGLKIKSMEMETGIKGEYDSGTMKQYIEKVIFTMES